MKMIAARDGSDARKDSWAKQCRWPLDARKKQEQEFSPEPQKESGLPAAYSYLSEADFRLLVSQTVRE